MHLSEALRYDTKVVDALTTEAHKDLLAALSAAVAYHRAAELLAEARLAFNLAHSEAAALDSQLAAVRASLPELYEAWRVTEAGEEKQAAHLAWDLASQRQRELHLPAQQAQERAGALGRLTGALESIRRPDLTTLRILYEVMSDE